MSENEKTRYSDEELQEFKQIILEKLAKAKADYDLLRSTITHTSSRPRGYLSYVQGIGGRGRYVVQGGIGKAGAKAIEIYPASGGGARPRREQDLRDLSRNGQADSQGASADRAARHALHRGERRVAQVVRPQAARFVFFIKGGFENPLFYVESRLCRK